MVKQLNNMTPETRNTVNLFLYAIITILLSVSTYFIGNFVESSINATKDLQTKFMMLDKDYGMWKADRMDMKGDVEDLKDGYICHDKEIQELHYNDRTFEETLKRNNIK